MKFSIAFLFSLVLLAGCTTPLPEGVYVSPYIGVYKSPQPSDKKPNPAPVEEAEEE